VIMPTKASSDAGALIVFFCLLIGFICWIIVGWRHNVALKNAREGRQTMLKPFLQDELTRRRRLEMDPDLERKSLVETPYLRRPTLVVNSDRLEEMDNFLPENLLARTPQDAKSIVWFYAWAEPLGEYRPLNCPDCASSGIGSVSHCAYSIVDLVRDRVVEAKKLQGDRPPVLITGKDDSVQVGCAQMVRDRLLSLPDYSGSSHP
jgi:hypothetical protein